jgi:hypothetical protein
LFPTAPDDTVPLVFEPVADLKWEKMIAWLTTALKTRPEVARVIEEITGPRKRTE